MAQLDLSLSDALSDGVAQPGQEPRVERDFVAQLESEAFDDQIGETVGKTDYIPLLDGDDTSTGDQDVGTALENGGKKAEGAQKPGSKGTAAMQPGRPEPHGEVRPRVDPPDLDSDLVSASMAQSPGPLGSLTGPAQVMDFSPVGSFSGFMEEGVPLLPEEWPQQHGPMLPEPQPPRGPMNLAPDSQTPGKSVDKADTKDNQMEDSMERLDEYVQLDEGERRSAKVEKAAKVEKQEQEEQNKPATVKEKEMEKKEPAKEKETDEETQAEKMEDRVEKTPDKPQLVDVAATGAEKAEKAAEGQTEKRMPVSGADWQAVVTQQTKPEETVKVTAMPETTEAGDAEGTEVSEAEPSPETRQTPFALDTGFATPEKHIDTSMEDAKVEQSKVEVTSVEDFKVEQSKVEVTLVEDTKAEQSKVEVTLVEDAKAEQSKVEVTSVEDTKVEQSKVEVTSVEDAKAEQSKVEVTSVEDFKVEQSKEPVVSIVDKVEKTEEEELTEKPHEQAEPERQEEEMPVGKAVPTKEEAKEEVKKTAERKEVKREEKKEKSGKLDTVTKKPAARPSTGTSALGKEPPSPEKKAKPATTATKLLPATKARPGSAAAAPTRRPASSPTTTTTTSTSISATLAKKTPAAKPASLPTGAPKRAPGLATSRPSSSVTSASTAPREVKPKTTTTTAAERRAPGSKVTTIPAARPTAGPAPNRNGTAARMTAPPRPALSTAAKKPLASKPDSKLGEERKPATLKTASADPSKPRASSTPATTTTTTERKALVSRAPRPTSTTSTTRTTSTSTSSRPLPRPGTAPGPDVKNARSKVGSMERTKPTGVKVSSASQNKGAASKDPSQSKVQILNKKVDLSKVTSKCGSKDNIKHKPGGGVVKIESHRVNIKDKAQSKVGSMDNLGGTPGKGDGIQEPAEGGSMRAPAVSAEPPEAPASQENGLKEGGPCGTEGLCEAPVLDTRIPETIPGDKDVVSEKCRQALNR